MIRLRFLGLSATVWTRDIFAIDVEGSADRLRPSQALDGGLPGEIMKKAQALIDHQAILVDAGRVALKLARRFRGWWQLEKAAINIELGLGNPAHTGAAHGALSAIAGILAARWPQIQIVNSPDFDRLRCRSHGEVVVKMRAWDPFWDIARFVGTLPWRGLWKLKRELAYDQTGG